MAVVARGILRALGLAGIAVGLLLTAGGLLLPGWAGGAAEVQAGPAGGRILLEPGGLGVRPGRVDILSKNLYDYTFSSAPVDWRVGAGTWESTIRWTCEPEWSWYGGWCKDGPAAIWNKREFAGDIVVELYAAFQMGFDIPARTRPKYKNPRDIHITIHGDGTDLDSGYTFMVGAEKNTVTRIMKGTQVLAATTSPEALFPIFEDGYPGHNKFHRYWWGVRAVLSGSRLQLFLDNKLVCEAQDPEPVTGGHVAIWTYDDGILTPRIKIYYEEERLPRGRLPTHTGDGANPKHNLAPDVIIGSPSHPAIQNDFENGLGQWKRRGGDEAAELAIVAGGPGGKGHCLRLSNPHPGGTFAAAIHADSFEVTQMGLMSFDYRADPDVAVNLYLTADGDLYEIVFTRPPSGAPQARQLGRIEGVRADGKWHHAEFDLLGHLQQALGRLDNITAEDLFVGNLNERDYLGAGFGANHAGASYYLDNFALLSPSAEATVELELQPGLSGEPSGYAVVLDDQPLASAAPVSAATQADLTRVTAPGTGTWYVHVYPRLADDRWGNAATYQVRVDQEAPQLVAQPASGEQLADEPIHVAINDPGGAGLDLSALVVDIGRQRHTWEDAAVQYQPAHRRLRIEPRLAGLGLTSGDVLRITVRGVRDRAGNRLEQPAELRYQVNLDADSQPPLLPTVTLGEEYLCHEDFETGIGTVTPYPRGDSAVLARDDSTAASGRYSLRVYNPIEGGPFGVCLHGEPFDAGKYRLVTFDYKIPPRLRVDLAIEVDGKWRAINFTDKPMDRITDEASDCDDDLPRIGAVANVIADNRWHHAEVNLFEILRATNPGRRSFMVSRMVLADFGWLCNVEGQTYHLDNFQIIPLVASTGPLRLIWQALDLSGIAGVAWSLDDQPRSVPGTQISVTSSPVQLTSVEQHDGWLHLRACDKAGNWSETTHRRVIFDGAAPRVALLEPGNQERAAPDKVKISLQDEGPAGINPATIRLTVKGRD